MTWNIDIFECKMVLITKLKENQSFEQYLHSSLFAIKASFVGTGGPLLTQKSLTRYPLPRFFGLCKYKWGIFTLVGDSTVPLTRVLHYAFFFQIRKSMQVGDPLYCDFHCYREISENSRDIWLMQNFLSILQMFFKILLSFNFCANYFNTAIFWLIICLLQSFLIL